MEIKVNKPMKKILKKLFKKETNNVNPILQYDGIEEGYFVGWVSSDVTHIEIFIEGEKVAEGMCNQVRDDVKRILGVDAKGFYILFDGVNINPNWLFTEKLTVTVVALNDNNIKTESTISPSKLVADVLFYNKQLISHYKAIIVDSSLWDETYYCAKIKGDRVAATDKVKDYILFGNKLNMDPCATFSTEKYLNELVHNTGNSDEIKVPAIIHSLSEAPKAIINTDVVDVNEDRLGYCEYVILGSQFAMIVGWYISDDTLAEAFISLRNHHNMLASNAKIMHISRPDVKAAFPNRNVDDLSGFMALVEITEKSSFDSKVSLSIHLSDEMGAISVNPEHIYFGDVDTNINCSRILNNWNPELVEHKAIAGSVILSMIHELYPTNKPVASKRYDYGTLNTQPKGSVIIPLYRRFDFMRYQISNFSRYKGMNDIEVIYVVDDPSISLSVLKLAVELHKVFNFNFSVVTLENNVGFGRANNMAVEYATSENLILLNSDVLPKDGAWAKQLIDNLTTLPNAGLVGARLLFEDESIQHDGMAPMLLGQYPGLIFNDHPMKGLPVSLSNKEKIPEACVLVTAACVAIKKSLFNSLNGFDPAYVLGDFEDSDLCLRAIDQGKINYICRDITLNHLERLSQNLVEPGDWKHKLTLLNANTYNQRWSKNLQTLFPVELKEFKNA